MAIVPIAILRRSVVNAWWVTDGGGAPLTVLSRTRSTELLKKMVMSTLPIIGLEKPETQDEIEKIFDFIDNSEGMPALPLEPLFAHYPELNTEGKEHVEDPGRDLVLDLVKLVANSWIVLIEIPIEKLDKRIIVKYGYDLILDPHRNEIFADNDAFSFPVEDPGFSSSLHHEIRVPPELVVSETSLEHNILSGAYVRVLAKIPRPSPISHVQSLRIIPRFGKATLEFRVRPANGGIRTFTGWTLILVGLIVAMTLAIGIGPQSYYLKNNWLNSASAAVILVGPALFLSWLARTPEAAIVATSLWRLRLINILLSFVMLTMAVSLSLAWTPLIWNLIWWTSYALYGVAVILWAVEKSVRKKTLYSSTS